MKWVCMLFLLLFPATVCFAQIPKTMSYQGLLRDNETGALLEGEHTLTFNLYQGESAGDASIWSEEQTVTVNEGVFNITLGSVNPLDITFDKPYCLEIVIDDQALSPAIPLTASPYSFMSQSVADGAAVKSINGLTDDITLAGDEGVTISSDGNTLTISMDSSQNTDFYDDRYVNEGQADAITSGMIPNGGITLPKISTTGASSGKALMYDGSNLTWQTPQSGGLTLPYAGITTSSMHAFYVENDGTGYAGGFTSSIGTSLAALTLSNNFTGYFFGVSNTSQGIYTYAPTGALAAESDGSGNTIQSQATGNGWAGAFFATGNSNGVYISAPFGKTGLNVGGGLKSAVVSTSQGARKLYTEESTEVWFTDYGFGTLNNGSTIIAIDPLFAETVSLSEPYHVFIEEYGDADLYVTNRTSDSFEVRLRDGDSATEFSYRIVAKRNGYEQARLEHEPAGDIDPNLYPEKSAEFAAKVSPLKNRQDEVRKNLEKMMNESR